MTTRGREVRRSSQRPSYPVALPSSAVAAPSGQARRPGSWSLSIARISRGRSRSRVFAPDRPPLLSTTFSPQTAAGVRLNELPKLRTRVRFSSPAPTKPLVTVPPGDSEVVDASDDGISWHIVVNDESIGRDFDKAHLAQGGADRRKVRVDERKQGVVRNVAGGDDQQAAGRRPEEMRVAKARSLVTTTRSSVSASSAISASVEALPFGRSDA